MIAAWLIAKALAPRYAIVVTLLVGGIVAWAGGDVVTDKLTFSGDARIYCARLHLHQPGEYWLALLPGDHGLAKCAGFATMKASGYPLAVSPLIIVTGGWRCCFLRLASFLSASRPLPPPFVKARMHTRMPVNAGWRPSQPAGFICWRGFSAAPLPG
jgi:hypothetical protein